MVKTAGANIFRFYLPTKIVHGPNSVEETGKEFKTLGAARALVVTDSGVRNAGLVDGVLKSLDKSGIRYVVFDEVEENPGGSTVAKGVELALKEKCDGIIVVGGGSPICAGRAIGVVVANGGKIRDYVGSIPAAKPPLPLIAIPTTAGSGAEVSQFIVLKDEELNKKMVARSPLYFPKTAILDPLLLKGLPFAQFVASGIDALAHAIEAYSTNLCTPITDALAFQSVCLIHQNLRQAAMSDDLDAKEACLIGSTMANMACGNSRLGLAHAMAGPVEVLFKIPHGIAVGVLLPYIMEFNLPAGHQRFAALARAMVGTDDIGYPGGLPEAAIRAVKGLFIDLDFPTKYSKSQVDPKSIPDMARTVAAEAFAGFDPTGELPMNVPVASANIRRSTIGDLIRLYEKAFEGWQL
ncbi:MAG: iron-containing alcohol dehydrogenase [Desulfobacterales bacterium]|nr:iron-containing alcohol dehydrogenase [Desulfobacterales bacterium]